MRGSAIAFAVGVLALSACSHEGSTPTTTTPATLAFNDVVDAQPYRPPPQLTYATALRS